MNYSQSRKINPYKNQRFKPDGTILDNDRVEIGPTDLAFKEWMEAGLEIPNLPKMRFDRVERLKTQIKERNLDGVLVFDPLNIRYITDSTNMQLWNSHNPFRACFINPDGYIILWDYKGIDMLSSFNPLVKSFDSCSLLSITAPAKTGPNKHPFPTSSIPAIRYSLVLMYQKKLMIFFFFVLGPH